MQITFLINSLSSGGAEKVVSVLLAELVKKKHTVELICLEKNIFYQVPREVKITYLSKFTGAESGLKKLLYLPIFATRLKKHIKVNNIKLVQSHTYRSNYVNILAKIFGAKHETQIVNTGAISKYHNEGVIGKINLILIKYLYPRADLIITKAKGMQLDMQNLFSLKNSQVVINNPYDIKKIESMSSELIDDFEFKLGKKYIISVGRFETFKRQDVIIESLNRISDNVDLILIGDGYKRKELELLCDDLGLKKRVHFIGRVSNPYKYISRSDLYVLSSENGEGFPNVLVESMICETVVIASDCVSGPREILAPDTDVSFQLKDDVEFAKYGLLFPIGDVQNLTDAINFLLDNTEMKKKYVQNAKKRVEDFSVNKITTQYEKVLNVE